MNMPVTIHPPLHVAQHSVPSRAPLTKILVVGNDAGSRNEICELLQSLGYSCVGASDALDALRIIAADHSVGIVLSDLKMEKLDGLFLMNEIAERFMALRPIVTIALGEAASDLNVEVMRSGASDLLVKPLAADSLSCSLRRATARWTRLAHQFQAATALALAGDPLAKQAQRETIGAREPSYADLQALGTKIIKSLQSRSDFINRQLLNEASWSILLDLAVAHLKGERVATSSACAAAQIPLSTALRHVNQLIEAGWIKRVGDPRDKRRTFLELQPRFVDVMTNYLKVTWHMFAIDGGRHH